MSISTAMDSYIRGKLNAIIIALSWSGYAVVAQTPLEELDSFKEKYPNESAVVTDKWKEIHISIVADSLHIQAESYEETLVMSNSGSWIKDKVFSSSFSYVDEIDAYTLIPGRRKYKKIPVETFNRSFDRESYVFYDDSEWISFTYPQVDIGSKVVNQYDWEITKPQLLPKFYFSSYVPAAKARYRIVADPGVDLGHHIYNDDLDIITTKEYLNEEGRQVYEFVAEEIDKVTYESDNPSFSYLTPVVYVRVKGFQKSDGNYERVLATLDDLHTWYRTFLEGLDDSEPIKDLLVGVVSSEDEELEKIRKIFYWVQENVRYIAFEQGMRGFVPHPAKYVLEKRYGDCKDMSSLLVAALRSAGIDANFTWIGSRNLPYQYTEVPAPIVDDHMIASVDINGTRTFLDATGSYTPLGYPTSMIQGKEALISLGEQKYVVERVPVVSREENMMIDTSYVSLEGGTLTGKATMKLSGLVKVANTYKLITQTSTGQEKYLRRLLSKGSNKFLLSNYELQHVEDLDQPIEISYDFTVGDYYKEIGDELYVNLYLDKSLVGDLLKDRKTPRENDYRYINRSSVVLDIPEGYKVEYVPDNMNQSWDHFGFDITHKQVGNQVIVTKEFFVDYLLLNPDAFGQWNEGIKTYNQALRNTIILKKTTK